MRKAMLLFCVALLAVVCCKMVPAQEGVKATDTPKAPELAAHYYHLEFLVQELSADGKPVNSRSYTTTASTDRGDLNASIRTGSRVPVSTGVGNSFQYMDVGVNIDVRNTHEVNGKLAISLSADVSSLASPAGLSQPSAPVVRNNRWQGPVIVSLNKPTVLFKSDALDSAGNMQLVVTATPLQ